MAQSTENQDFTKVYDSNFKQIHSYIAQRIKNQAISEELTNDVFLKAYSHFSTFNVNLSSVTTWLHTIAKNTIIDYFRSKNNHQKDTFTEMPENSDYLQVKSSLGLASDLIEGKQLKASMLQAFSKLKETEINCINLWFIEGKSLNEIASILNIPLGTAKVTILRAKDKLRVSLKPAYAML